MAAWYDEYNNNAQKAVAAGANHVFQVAPTTVEPTKKKKDENPLAGLLPTGGGIAGTLGGAAAGAALGSAVPVVGTAIGGLLGAILGGAGGSALGKVGENAVEGNSNLGDGVLGEALMGGITSLPIGAGLKVAQAGTKLATGLGKASARDLLEQAGAKTLSKGAVAKYGLDTPGAVQQAAGDALTTSIPGRLKTAGDKTLLTQYGTISKPFARSTDPAATISTLADIGITKPVDAERIAGAITGANGILTRATSEAVGKAGGVDTSTLRRVFNDALDNYGVVEKDRQSLQKVFDAQMNRLAGGARGSLDPKANPTDALEMMRSLEKRIANLNGKGDNYRLTTPERSDQASVLQLVRDELENALYAGAGADKNLGTVLTPQVRESLVALHPDNAKWVQYVDKQIMGAKSVSDIRSAAAPFVRVGKIINEGEQNGLTAGGRLGNAFAGGGLKSMIGEAATNMIKNPVANAAGNALRGVASLGSKAPTGQGLLGVAARQSIPRAVIGSAQPSADAMTLQDALAMQNVGAGVQGVDTTLQTAPSNPVGYSSTELGQALMKAYAAGDKASAGVLSQMYQLASEFEKNSTSMDSTTEKALGQAANAQSTLAQLEQLFTQAGGAQNRLGGSLNTVLGNVGLNSNAKAYDDLVRASVAQIARAMGETGVITDADSRRYEAALPKLTDTPQEAQVKLQALRQRMAQMQQNAMLYGGGGSDLASVLGSAQ